MMGSAKCIAHALSTSSTALTVEEMRKQWYHARMPCTIRIEARNVVADALSLCLSIMFVQLLSRKFYAHVRWHGWKHASSSWLARSLPTTLQSNPQHQPAEVTMERNANATLSPFHWCQNAPATACSHPSYIMSWFFVETPNSLSGQSSDHIMSLMLILLLLAPLLLGLGDTDPGCGSGGGPRLDC